MITRTAPILQGSNWKNQLAQAIRDPLELLKRLELPLDLLPGAITAARQFPLRVPPVYLKRIRRGDPDDPLLRQILPLGAETESACGYTNDPVGDLQTLAVPGLLHKYQGRALLVTTGACAIHCRYCFRRHFPYNLDNPAQDRWQPAIDYLSTHDDIQEIILSGGDPLSLSDQRLSALITALQGITHIKTLRLHTRLPVVIPQRITQALLDTLIQSQMHVVMVLHINHANEIDPELRSALDRVRQAGCTLLNQSVLLKGVNDSVDALRALSLTLFDHHILPYYLHQLDKVNGAAHFAVNEQRATQLVKTLREQLPGYLVPRLVQEQAGQPSKTPLL